MKLLENPELLGHWRYFLLLESDFELALRYVDPHPKNRKTFSLEFAKQLLVVCAQFEVITRLLCEGKAQRKPRSLTELYTVLAPTAPGLTGWGVTFLLRNERIFPFKKWGSSSVPVWWTSCNSIKHQPLAHPEAANIDNVLHALAGLGLLTTRYLGHETGPWTPRLFNLNYG